MQHLSAENRVRLTGLRGGLPVARVATEHEADEIGTRQLYTEHARQSARQTVTQWTSFTPRLGPFLLSD